MIEDRCLEWLVRIIQPVECLHQISRDPSCRRKIQAVTKNESTGSWQTEELTAVQIQELYLKQAQNYLSANSDKLPAKNRLEFEKIVKEWKKLDKLKVDPMLLKEEIDWVIKKNLLEEYKKNRRIDWNHPDLKIFDILYHHIDRNQGLYYLLEREGKVRRILGDEEIKRARNRPPETRAKWRATLIKTLEKKRILYNSSWNQIWVYPCRSNDEDENYFCLDPFYSGSPERTKNQEPIEIP